MRSKADALNNRDRAEFAAGQTIEFCISRDTNKCPGLPVNNPGASGGSLNALRDDSDGGASSDSPRVPYTTIGSALLAVIVLGLLG